MYHSGNPETLRSATEMVPASTSDDLFPLQKAVLNGPVQRTPWPCSAVLPLAVYAVCQGVCMPVPGRAADITSLRLVPS
jgi:hypothetical protein